MALNSCSGICNLSECWDMDPEGKQMKVLNLDQKKVEALQEKWVAAIMMHNEEYTDARHKLLKAKLLYPELDHISLMLTICEILLLASTVRISNNNIDFHCILDLIYPSATYSDAVNSIHYFVTSINGVKDEFPGAQLALEIVQNALNMLSDREEHFHDGFRPDNDFISYNEIIWTSTSERCSDSTNPDVPPELGILEESTEIVDIGENTLCGGNFQWADDFASGQVWAIYCGEDTMPRQYALVNSVVCDRKVWVTILEPEPLVHGDKNNWREDLPIACGMFKPGDSNLVLDMSQFSHLVKHEQGTTMPHCMIYPQKGEVWVMYKNWNRKWGHTDYEKCQYWMVEIISNFSRKNGIEVAKLEEVQNWLTFFCRQRHEGDYISRTICETEMLCFSHQVLAYRVHGIEKYGIPEDSWHLEPKAIPISKLNKYLSTARLH
ncbi:hypothetical protein VNO78_02280 [Psophocarpus tetragonolobus]|uniref:DUF3444 domain-containing protein n=1 Tax=Psophocarpus tetragonolobus TaxID=3891 RepID=A0AAN9XV07_PSOTE